MSGTKRPILSILAAVVIAAGFQPESSAQRRRDQFSHATAAHKRMACNSCHTMPSGNWAGTRGYPDVAKFPGHAACASCHRPDFFKLGSAFCAVCHSSSSNPRNAPLYGFPVRTRSQEFSTIFPHNVHQDLIAKDLGRPNVAVAHYAHASFRRPPADDVQFNSCAVCHTTPKDTPKFGPRTPDAALRPLADPMPDVFPAGREITAKLFKDSPDNHASCFTCHYTGVKPVAASCAGCHSLTQAYRDSSVIPRYSLRFNHETEIHRTRDCVVCHVRITQNADIRQLKDADVPILTCSTSSCHGGSVNDLPPTDPKYPTSAIANEIAAREDSLGKNQPAFQCNYCHSTAIGRFPIPPSHTRR